MVGLAASVAVRIQHHPLRVGLPRRLIEHLGAFEDVTVIADEPAGSLDAWRVHRACLEAMPASASHLLVLQDDALPVANFAERFLAALEQQPDAVLCLFTPGFGYLRRSILEARAAGLSFLPLRVGAFVPCVAVSYPRAFVEGLLRWAHEHENGRQRRQLRGADDGVLAFYCRQARRQPLLMVPSIVEHDESVASIGKLHRRAGPHRRAALL